MMVVSPLHRAVAHVKFGAVRSQKMLVKGCPTAQLLVALGTIKVLGC